MTLRRLLLVLAVALAAWPAVPARAAATDPIAHDPTLIKEGRFHYGVTLFVLGLGASDEDLRRAEGFNVNLWSASR